MGIHRCSNLSFLGTDPIPHTHNSQSLTFSLTLSVTFSLLVHMQTHRAEATDQGEKLGEQKKREDKRTNVSESRMAVERKIEAVVHWFY